MKRASEWIAASRWFRVAIPHFRESSKMLKKMPHDICGEIEHRDLVDLLLYLSGPRTEAAA